MDTMKKTETDLLLEEAGFKLYMFKKLEHIVEYINETSGLEVRYNLISKTVRLKKHLSGTDLDFECDQTTLDLITIKMLELLKEVN